MQRDQQHYLLSHLILTNQVHPGTVLEQTSIETSPHRFFWQEAFFIPRQNVQKNPFQFSSNPASNLYIIRVQQCKAINSPLWYTDDMIVSRVLKQTSRTSRMLNGFPQSGSTPLPASTYQEPFEHICWTCFRDSLACTWWDSIGCTYAYTYQKDERE